LRAGVARPFDQPEIGERDRHLVEPRIVRSGTMARLFLGERPLLFLLGLGHRPDDDEEHKNAQRDVPILDREADQQHDPEHAPASAGLLLDDCADRLLLPHCRLSSHPQPDR
jgi:hypothetical protein